MLILGIETSCDETAAALVDGEGNIRSQALHSQVDDHQIYGGVVPEIASREHLRLLAPLVRRCLGEAGATWPEIDAIAVTAGPGLIGGVMVGVMLAKGLAAATGKPLIAVNHLEAHALTVRMLPVEQLISGSLRASRPEPALSPLHGAASRAAPEANPGTNASRPEPALSPLHGAASRAAPEANLKLPFPYLMLLVSGGHCQFLVVEGVGRYHLLGQTIDDALGEAFDKVAKMLGLPYPGGPQVERLARSGDAMRFRFPLPLCQQPGCDFSFSGLKTAVLRQYQRLQQAGELTAQDKADLAASFQQTVGLILTNRLSHALQAFKEGWPEGRCLVLAGGVAANQALRQVLEQALRPHDVLLLAPPLNLCTDNAAMVAWAGVERFRLGLIDDLALTPRARWPLADLSG